MFGKSADGRVQVLRYFESRESLVAHPHSPTKCPLLNTKAEFSGRGPLNLCGWNVHTNSVVLSSVETYADYSGVSAIRPPGPRSPRLQKNASSLGSP